MAVALAFVDFSPATGAVVRMARDTALALGMTLILMHVSIPDAEAEGRRRRTDFSRKGVATELHEYHQELEILAVACTKFGVPTTPILVRGASVRGSPVRKMVSEVKRIQPDLIVMGTHQHSRLFEAIFGSAESSVIHKASCPILLIPSQNPSIAWPVAARTNSRRKQSPGQ